MKTAGRFVCVAVAAMLLFQIAPSQKKPAYSYAAQRALIPAELGRVYLGMPLKDLAAEVDLQNAEIDDRFSDISIRVPLAKGNVTELVVKVHGLTDEDRQAIVYQAKARMKDSLGEEYDADVKRARIDKIADRGFVYAMYVTFRKEFDQKAWVIKTYGTRGTVRKPDDEYYFSDIEWTKKTSDGLLWLIRSLHEGDSRSLQLLGRIPGTEWGLDGVN